MKRLAWLSLLLLALAGSWRPARGETIEFNRDIRPILSENCFACHGHDKPKRKADLRLDNAEGAFADRGDNPVLVPKKPADSELFKRITEKDSRRRMPPASTGKKLSAKQIDLIRRWIEQGAVYQKHWALIAPVRPTLPKVQDEKWGRNAIDSFLLARIEAAGLKPTPQANRRALLRRLSFDLLGLPPTPEQIDAFIADRSDKAYEKAVDRLLASKHFGERVALAWLDLVRFADTAGYHSDNHRDISLYRDYVIRSFNENKRFDRFTTEQLAGDLLPNATPEQKIASGYNRLLMTTEEGGAQAKEYLAKYAADRVRNASSVWLGLTMGCAECHDHKFDPISTKEFYRFASFWADIQEVAVGRQPQTKLPTLEQSRRLQAIAAELEQQRKLLDTPTPALAAAQKQWEEKVKADLAGAKLPATVVEALKVEESKRSAAQKTSLASFYRGIAPELNPTRTRIAALQREKASIDKASPQTLISISGSPRTMRVLKRGNWLDDSGEIVSPGTPASLAVKRSPPTGRPGKPSRALPRPARLAGPTRGEGKERLTRLDLAKWMVAPDHPLTARVFVNRLWKMFFGQGIVTTLDDFGSQGTWPTHPELLDWLAREFIESGWDVKYMVKLMVTSAAYRQASVGNDTLRNRDPYNHLLARQARFRLDAEMVRDNALAVSGLLSRKIGGPSVKPYQPAGYWAYLNFPKRDYAEDKGENQHRRGLYTYWQRTFPHPSLIAFDAPSREECTVDRPRSNTPQQALVLLNDPSYVEAARALADKVLLQGGKTDEERLHFAYRQVLGRKASQQELGVLLPLLRRHVEQYKHDKDAVDGLLKIGQAPVSKDADRATLASWISITRVLLNLHETITRE